MTAKRLSRQQIAIWVFALIFAGVSFVLVFSGWSDGTSPANPRHGPTTRSSFTPAEGGAEVFTREQLAARFNRRVAEPNEDLSSELKPEVIRLMSYHMTASFDEYSHFRKEAGLPTLPDEPFRGNHDLVLSEMRRLTFRWDECQFLVVREGTQGYMLTHEGMAAVDRTRPNSLFPDFVSVPIPNDSYRVVCRVPVNFQEVTDGVTSGTYYIFLSNSLASGKWVIYKIGISSSGNNSEAWRKFVGPIF